METCGGDGAGHSAYSGASKGAFHRAVGHKGMERKPFNEDRLQWEKVHINTLDAPEE